MSREHILLQINLTSSGLHLSKVSGTVPEDVEARYITIIDAILATSDLNTISEKRIRKGLQAIVQHDITPQKVSRTSNWDE